MAKSISRAWHQGRRRPREPQRRQKKSARGKAVRRIHYGVEDVVDTLAYSPSGQTAWSLSGAHTGRPDLPLTDTGPRKCPRGGPVISRAGKFALVLAGPLSARSNVRANPGYGDVAQADANLCEWNYGDYEGRTTPEILKERPDWSLWRDGPLNGEAIEQVGARGDDDRACGIGGWRCSAIRARAYSANSDCAMAGSRAGLWTIVRARYGDRKYARARARDARDFAVEHSDELGT